MNSFFKLLLSNIISILSNGFGFFHDTVIPCIKFVEGIKFTSNLNQKTLAKHDFIEYLSKKFAFSDYWIKLLMDAFTDVIKNIIPDIDKDFTDAQKAEYFVNVLLAFFKYIKTQTKWQRDLIWLKLGSMILIYVAGKHGEELKDHEAQTMIQIAYSNNKLQQKF